MIGGLADWYAVTALFTKPLGIPFKTAILPRSKERLIQIGRTMLSEELLRVPQMYYAIKKERVMVRIIEYGMSDVGQGQIRDILYGVGNQVLSHMDIEPMRQEINKAVYKGVTNWKATPLVILFGRCMLERQTASVFWLYFNRTCQRVIASNQVYPYLYRVMLDIMKTYTKDSFFRELAIAFGGDGLSPERLVETVQKKAVQFLKDNESIDSDLGRYVWAKPFVSSIIWKLIQSGKLLSKSIKINGLKWFSKNGKVSSSTAILWTGNASWISLSTALMCSVRKSC